MAFSWAPMTILRCASCSVLVPVPKPTLMVMSLRAFQSRGSTVTHWLRRRAVCGCEPCLRAGLGEDACDHLHLGLRRVEHLVGDSCDLVLQGVRIDALALPRHARAPLARGLL